MNKLRNTWAAILKTSALSGYKFMTLVGRAKDKNIKAEDRRKFDIGKDISQVVDHSGSYGLAFIVNQKWKNMVYKLGKVDERTQILQPARSRKTEMVLNQAQKIRLKNSSCILEWL